MCRPSPGEPGPGHSGGQGGPGCGDLAQVDSLEQSLRVGQARVEAACWAMVDSGTVSLEYTLCVYQIL